VVNVARLDGSVDAISNTVDPAVWTQLHAKDEIELP